MKLRVVVQIVIGFIITWLTASIIGKEHLHMVILAIPVLGFVHEFLHFISLKLFKLNYSFIVKGLLVGFKTSFKNFNQFIIAAAIPQVITLVLVLIYIFTSNIYTLTLSLLHIAISSEDLIKIFKYLIDYFV